MMVKLNSQQIELLEIAASDAEGIAEVVRFIVEQIQKPAAEGSPWIDRVAEMPFNPWPDHPDMMKLGWTDWPHRELVDIKGITIHHTMSHSPLATARYCTSTKGYPSVQYHLWVSQDDGCPVYLLAPLEWSLWHDHTGRYQKTVSVGMAGRLHESKPPPEQLEATAKLVTYLMDMLNIPTTQVKGHIDRAPGRTDCPGWYIAEWYNDFYRALEAAL